MAANSVGYSEHLLRIAKSSHLFTGDLSVSLPAITEAAANALQVERVSVWFFNGERTGITCADLYEKPTNRHSSGAILEAREFPRYFSALGEERVIAAHNAMTDACTSEFADAYLRPLNIHSMLDAPIHLRGELVGIICHEHIGSPRIWSSAEMVFGASMADYIALSMEANDRARAEQALRKEIKSRASQERLAALGEMSAVVAHEVRNPIGAIYNTIACLRRIVGDTEQVTSLLDILDEEAQRIADLSSNLLDVARPVDVRLEPIDLHKVLTGAVSAATTNRSWLAQNLQLDVEIPTMPACRCDPRLLHRIVVNLLENASESANENTSVGFDARHDDADNSLHLLVTNHAKRLDPNTLDRMFDPFFTTKSVGSGLGLAIVKRLVEELGGSITIQQDGPVVSARVYVPLHGKHDDPDS